MGLNPCYLLISFLLYPIHRGLKLWNQHSHTKESTELPLDPFLKTNHHPMAKPLEQMVTDIWTGNNLWIEGLLLILILFLCKYNKIVLFETLTYISASYCTCEIQIDLKNFLQLLTGFLIKSWEGFHVLWENRIAYFR